MVATDGFSGQYRVRLANGHDFSCLVCSGMVFAYRAIKLNTGGMTFMGLDWANADSIGIACVGCGHMTEFVGRSVELVPGGDPA